MNWKLLIHNAHDGQYNMDFDIRLAKECERTDAYFRLYKWNPFTISLGANQKFEDINLDLAQTEGIGVVKRPTGGRAILHAEEITYSVVIPSDKIESSKSLYNKISLSLVEGLKIYDARLSDLELESLQPHFPSLLKEESGMICFSSTARHEVKYAGRKLIGSAQRKMNGVILQHGSILLGDYHLNLAKYLNVDDETKAKLLNEMKDKTISLEEILSEKIEETRLINSLVLGFEKTWDISFEKEKLFV